MAIWNGRPKTPKVLDAALRWRQECLLDDGGMFSSESLWTAANLEEVRSAFLGNPILGSEKFIDKLEQQVRVRTRREKTSCGDPLASASLRVGEPDGRAIEAGSNFPDLVFNG